MCYQLFQMLSTVLNFSFKIAFYRREDRRDVVSFVKAGRTPALLPIVSSYLSVASL